MYYFTITGGLAKLRETTQEKEKRLKALGRMDPTMIEKAMGVVCVLVTILNVYFKVQTNTLIFMFNPCHVVNVSVIAALSKIYVIACRLV